jgi:hypothetical protein
MQPRHFPLEKVILLYLFLGGVSFLAGMATESSLLRFIGGAILGTVLIPAMVLGPIMLLMRTTGWGMTRPNSPHPAQRDAQPDADKAGD